MIEAGVNVGGQVKELRKSIQLVAKLQMSVEESDNTTVTVVGTGDKSLVPPTGYVLIPNYEETSNLGDNSVFTCNPDGTITLHQQEGEQLAWMISAYYDVSHSSNNSTVGSALGIYRSGAWNFRPRAIHSEMPNLSDIGNMSGFGSADNVEDGDIIGIHIGSDRSGDVSIHTSGVVLDIYRILP